MIKSYIVIEIQTDSVGNIATQTFSFAGQDEIENRNEAESKYHDILHYASKSNVYYHSCVMLTGKGEFIKEECYEHKNKDIS